jgi:hypothetical protein
VKEKCTQAKAIEQKAKNELLLAKEELANRGA